MRRTPTLAAAVALALLGAACSDDDATVRAGAGDRAEPTDCGTFELGQVGPGPDGYEAGRQCLLDAFEAGTAALLRLDVPTVEGDPIHATFEITGVHEVVLTTDNRDDAFRGVDRLVERCTTLTVQQSRPFAQDCTTLEEVPRGSQEYETTGTVIEYEGQDPQLCLGPQAMIYPPSCTGARLVGWDWDDVDDEQTDGGRTWGAYEVRGTYVDEVFTLTAPPEQLPVHAPGELPPSPAPDLDTPCPEPSGGWRVVDAATTTMAAFDAANLYAQGQADYGAVWSDHSLNPVIADGYQPGEEGEWVTDPTKVILNASFTGDLARHEAEIRGIWGGPLCVSQAPRGWSELTRIAGELMRRPGIQSTAPDGVHGTVRVGVIVDDGLQERMDDEFGEGAVTVEPELRPVG